MAWTAQHDELVDSIRLSQRERVEHLAQTIDLNVPHHYRDGHYSLLFHASINGSSDIFEILLNNGADPSWGNDSRNSVIRLIIKRNQMDMLEMCLKHLDGENKSKFLNSGSTSSGWTPLMAAAQRENLDMVKCLVEAGAEINKVMATNWTALHTSAKVGDIRTVEYLLSKKAKNNIAANHRDFGIGVLPKDVTSDQEIISLLTKS